MNSIPRIHQLEVEIERCRKKIAELRGEIDHIKQLLAPREKIFAYSYKGLEFASSVPGFNGNLYGAFATSKEEFAAFCTEKGIRAELVPIFAILDDARNEAAGADGAIE